MKIMEKNNVKSKKEFCKRLRYKLRQNPNKDYSKLIVYAMKKFGGGME